MNKYVDLRFLWIWIMMSVIGSWVCHPCPLPSQSRYQMSHSFSDISFVIKLFTDWITRAISSQSSLSFMQGVIEPKVFPKRKRNGNRMATTLSKTGGKLIVDYCQSSVLLTQTPFQLIHESHCGEWSMGTLRTSEVCFLNNFHPVVSVAYLNGKFSSS